MTPLRLRRLRWGSLTLVLALPLPALAQEDDVEIEVEASPQPAPPPAAQSPAPAPPAAAPTPPVTPPPAAPAAPPSAPPPASTAVTPTDATSSPPAAPPARTPWLPPLLESSGVVVSGYLQPQVEWHQLSEDEIDPEGDPLNLDRFVVRRGRLRAERSWPIAHAALEIDANNVRGPFLSLRRAEASLRWPSAPGRDPQLPPAAQLTLGLQEIPFGFELRQGNAERVFVERTTGSLAFFRGEPDTGARLSGALGPVRYGLAIMNGVPVDDRPGAATQTYTAKKTRVGRIGLTTPPARRAEVAGGLSALTGTGFHAGNTATKSQLLWRDLNQDGLVALSELAAQPGQAATPSETYERWGLNADLQLGLETPIGWTRIYGEVTLASNLDRGLFVADPIATGYDLRELAWNAALVQDLSDFGLAGVRIDAYDGNADATEARRGLFVPTDQTITTISPLLGLRLPSVGRLVVQYDYVSDHLGRDDAAEPVDLANDVLTLRVQVEL